MKKLNVCSTFGGESGPGPCCLSWDRVLLLPYDFVYTWQGGRCCQEEFAVFHNMTAVLLRIPVCVFTLFGFVGSPGRGEGVVRRARIGCCCCLMVLYTLGKEEDVARRNLQFSMTAVLLWIQACVFALFGFVGLPGRGGCCPERFER